MLHRQIKTAFEDKTLRDTYLAGNGLELLNAYLYAVAEEMPDIFSFKAEPNTGLSLQTQGRHSFNIIPQGIDQTGRWHEVLVEQIAPGEEPEHDIITNATHPEIQAGLLAVLSWWCENQCPQSMVYEFAQADGWARRKVMLTNIDWIGRHGREPD